jgi:lysophospholipid acyltransferase (LPLAT)-like uncharacterized protein
MTLDGPRGPRHVAKPGAVLLAQRAEAVVLAVGARYGRAWQLRNWDRFEIPLPFSRVVGATSEPFMGPADLSVEAGQRPLEARLAECEALAERRLCA